MAIRSSTTIAHKAWRPSNGSPLTPESKLSSSLDGHPIHLQNSSESNLLPMATGAIWGRVHGRVEVRRAPYLALLGPLHCSTGRSSEHRSIRVRVSVSLTLGLTSPV